MQFLNTPFENLESWLFINKNNMQKMQLHECYEKFKNDTGSNLSFSDFSAVRNFLISEIFEF